MMAIMMDRHGQRIDIRLERVVPIAERWNFEDGFGRRARAREGQASQPPPWWRVPKSISNRRVV